MPQPAPLGASQRPALPAFQLYLLTAAFILASHNATFWARLSAVLGDQPLSMAAFGGAVFGVALFTVALPAPGWLQKPVACGLLILGAVTSYYQDVLGATIDREMIQNAITSTPQEAQHLISAGFVRHVALWGVAPALVVAWVRVRPAGLLRRAATWAGSVALALVLFAGLILLDFKTLSSVIREHHEINSAIQPGQPVAAAWQYALMMHRARNTVVQPVGMDAQRRPRTGAGPLLTVIVVGETARAQNFGLGGYARDTTPQMAARNVVYFTDVTACGTSTAVSMPCMFSNLRRSGYSYQAGRSNQNLLDVLGHAGVKTAWFDNNTGDLGVAARTNSTMLTALRDPVSCAKGECEDTILLAPVAKILSEMTDDTVLVLHQIGSHGPSYHLRYPPGFEPFAPACQHAEFARCTNAEIVNAYDNSIAFTDVFLGRLIDLLNGQTRVGTAMLYISDHGESLGEAGLYLHAAPAFLAPDVQTKVPMALWFSPAYKAASRMNEACLRARTGLPLSHDNLFPTVLGIMGIDTTARDPALDLTEGCRNG